MIPEPLSVGNWGAALAPFGVRGGGVNGTQPIGDGTATAGPAHQRLKPVVLQDPTVECFRWEVEG